MENAIKKFFKKMLMNKYPIFLDVYVVPYVEGDLRYDNPFNLKRYEVIGVIHEKDFTEELYNELDEYVRNIAKYMDVEVMGVYNKVVDDKR